MEVYEVHHHNDKAGKDKVYMGSQAPDWGPAVQRKESRARGTCCTETSVRRPGDSTEHRLAEAAQAI